MSLPLLSRPSINVSSAQRHGPFAMDTQVSTGLETQFLRSASNRRSSSHNLVAPQSILREYPGFSPRAELAVNIVPRLISLLPGMVTCLHSSIHRTISSTPSFSASQRHLSTHNRRSALSLDVLWRLNCISELLL